MNRKEPGMKFFSRDDPQGEHLWPFCYFHDKAENHCDAEWNKKQPQEDWCAPDLPSCDTPRESFEDGIHDATLYGEPVKVYLWTDPKLAEYVVSEAEADTSHKMGDGAIHTRKGVMRHAFIVLVDDLKANTYAKKMYDAKSEHL